MLNKLAITSSIILATISFSSIQKDLPKIEEVPSEFINGPIERSLSGKQIRVTGNAVVNATGSTTTTIAYTVDVYLAYDINNGNAVGGEFVSQSCRPTSGTFTCKLKTAGYSLSGYYAYFKYNPQFISNGILIDSGPVFTVKVSS